MMVSSYKRVFVKGRSVVEFDPKRQLPKLPASYERGASRMAST